MLAPSTAKSAARTAVVSSVALFITRRKLTVCPVHNFAQHVRRLRNVLNACPYILLRMASVSIALKIAYNAKAVKGALSVEVNITWSMMYVKDASRTVSNVQVKTRVTIA
jgi:hypothetical protein